jgi:ribosomal-protein-alanine N-acetyltransferase
VISAGDARPVAAGLRPLERADLDDVLALERELFPEDAWSPEMFAEELAQPPGTRLYVLAETPAAETPAAGRADGGADPHPPHPPVPPVLAGYAGVRLVAAERLAEVMTIAVRPSSWGHGIGSALLAAPLAAARDRGCAEMFLEVRADNPRAHGLYLRRGFTDIGLRRGYYQPSGTDAIVMRKDLLR